MTDTTTLNFGVDMVTFAHPGFWGVEDDAAITALEATDPLAFWTKLLNAVAESGVTGVELTFAPFHWKNAVAAFGSQEAVAEALSSRGLTMSSGYLTEMAHDADIVSPEGQQALIDVAADYAAFLKACGAEVMAAGLPMRQTPGEKPVRFHNLASAAPLADFLNRMGAAVAEHGVQLALHTESHTVFARSRDVDLMMLLTDPQYVHFCPDSAHIVMSGGDPLMLADRHFDRIVLTHWKDAAGPMPADTPIDDKIFFRHRPYFRGLGQGCVDWPEWARRMGQRHAGLWHILELDAAADPVRDIRAGLAFAREMLSRG